MLGKAKEKLPQGGTPSHVKKCLWLSLLLFSVCLASEFAIKLARLLRNTAASCRQTQRKSRSVMKTKYGAAGKKTSCYIPS